MAYHLINAGGLIERFANHRLSSVMLHTSLLEDDVLRARAMLYGLGAIILFPCSVLVSLPYFAQGLNALGLMTLGFGIVGMCALLVLKLVGSLSLATHLVCAALWGATVSGYMVLGGVDSYTNKWLVLMPLIGAFSGKGSTGWIWLVIAFLTPISFHLMIEHGVLIPVSVFTEAQLLSMDLGNSMVFIASVALFTFVVHIHHTWVIARLDEREQALVSSNLGLVKARDEAVRANHSRDRFLQHMSHELRTPLNAMLGYVEIIQEELHDQDNSSHDHDFAKIKRAGAHLLNMLHDILELTKFESTQLELPIHAVDVAGIITTLVASAPREVSVVVHDSWHGVSILTHEETFFTMLSKVLDNACKYAASTERVGITLHARRDEPCDAIIEVFDEGIGIDASCHKQVWEPFSQVDGSSTRKQDGAGLGLTLVRHFSLNLGLSVTLESSPGEGTRILFHVPSSLLSTM